MVPHTAFFTGDVQNMSYCSETQAQHFPGVMGSSGSQSHRWESNEQWRAAIRKCLSYKIFSVIKAAPSKKSA